MVFRLVILPAKGICGGLYRLLVAPADGAHPRNGLKVEEAGDLPVGVEVGLAHELVADEGYACLAHVHHASPGCSRITVSFKKLTAFVKPSFTLINESSCSMEITPSYPASLSSLTRARQNSGPWP